MHVIQFNGILQLMPALARGTPWIDVNEDYLEWNCSRRRKRSGICLNYWRSILKIRKEWKDILIYGRFEMVTSIEDRKGLWHLNVLLHNTCYCNLQLFLAMLSLWTIPEEFENSKVILSNYKTDQRFLDQVLD